MNTAYKRVTAIILKRSKILLIHRKNHGLEYYSLPHYHMSDPSFVGHELEDKIKDHINVEISIKDCLQDYFYLCTYRRGEPKLSRKSIEVLTMESADQYFMPLWMPISKLRTLTFRPKLYTPLFDKKFKTLYGEV